jgi:catechol 2,3-dioxygenase-like lactoylglutathione lyase family enzyme
MIIRFVHVNIVVSDIDKSLKFYCDMLGGRAVGDDRKAVAERGVDSTTVGIAMGFGGKPEWRATYIHFGEGADFEAMQIDLLQWIKPASYGKPYGRMNHIGIPRIALAVDDVDKTYNDLKVKGVEFISPPQVIDLKRGRGPGKIVACKDPDGTVIEFTQRR